MRSPVRRIHFIGVCGTAMATLAAMLKARGLDVQGSDKGIYPPMSEFLAAEGIRTFEAYRAERSRRTSTSWLSATPCRAATSSSRRCWTVACATRRCPRRSATYFSLGRAIDCRGRDAWQDDDRVDGGLAVDVRQSRSERPHRGHRRELRPQLSPRRWLEFVIEGDEYDSAYFDKTAKFLKYRPDIAVVGNLEYDHADIYPDMESLRTAFRRFVNLVPRQGLVVIGADSPEAARLAASSPAPVETVGLADGVDWQAGGIEQGGGRSAFAVAHRGVSCGRFEMSAMGEHNIRNALAAIAVGHAVGFPTSRCARVWRASKGVRRRLEFRGRARGVAVYDDFAHHPTAILETIRALRASQPGHRVWAIFEPRSATSCRRVFQADFARAFADSGADEIVLAPVFRASLPEAERLSVGQLIADLTAAGRQARAPGSTAEIVRLVAAEAREGDLVLVMSNGGFDGIHDQGPAGLA